VTLQNGFLYNTFIKYYNEETNRVNTVFIIKKCHISGTAYYGLYQFMHKECRERPMDNFYLDRLLSGAI